MILQRGRVVYFGVNGAALSDYFGQAQLQARRLNCRPTHYQPRYC